MIPKQLALCVACADVSHVLMFLTFFFLPYCPPV
jgi:hypothetical protein